MCCILVFSCFVDHQLVSDRSKRFAKGLSLMNNHKYNTNAERIDLFQFETLLLVKLISNFTVGI